MRGGARQSGARGIGRRRAPRSGAGLGLLLALPLTLGLPLAAAAAETPAPRPRPVLVAPADAAVDPVAEADLFAMPEVAAAIRTAFAGAEAGDPAGALALLDGQAARHPRLGPLQAARAAVAMLAGDPGTALAALEAAAADGLPDIAAVAADPLFDPLAADPAAAPRLAALAATPAPAPSPAAAPAAAPAPAPAPAPIADGRARVGAGNTAWDPERERLEARFAVPAAAGPVLPARPKRAAYDILREHAKRGRAAGNTGDLYDNRDRGHSTLKPGAFPQLAFTEYAPAARAADLDYGLADRLIFDRPTFGNSSTAVTAGPFWRSLPRLAMTKGDGTGPLRLWQNAAANQLYIYPAHRDWTDKDGDLFPANTPYILVSRGASGSDQPFLEAVALILAAFRPDTKARLEAENLLVPTVQMVFRRSLQTVRSRDAYFSAAAWAAATDGAAVNPARMVSLANAIRADAIPPEVRIAVEAEDLGTEGIDYFGQGLTEQLFDTPGAVARVWRSKAGRRSMTVSAAATRDPNGRPLDFHWTLLQGDPAKVTIEPLDDGSRARITLDWHDPYPISEDDPTVTARVDVGVFASNGVHDSAPAIISWYMPPNETRTYAPGPDGAPRIVAIDHADPAKAKTYADPMLVPRADWRDDFAFAPDGSPAGWTRVRPTAPSPETAPETAQESAQDLAPDPSPATERFTADGRRLLDPDDPAGPTAAVAHILARDAGGRLEVRELDAGF